jgi:hypothetical protein
MHTQSVLEYYLFTIIKLNNDNSYRDAELEIYAVGKRALSILFGIICYWLETRLVNNNMYIWNMIMPGKSQT